MQNLLRGKIIPKKHRKINKKGEDRKRRKKIGVKKKKKVKRWKPGGKLT